MRKLFPYLFSFITVLAAAVYFFCSNPVSSPWANVETPTEEETSEQDSARTFTGRVVMPDVENIMVLENSAGRDIEKLALFFSGRAAGLHWLARPYFKNYRAKDDIVVEVNLTVDSLGRIACGNIEYTNAKDETFRKSLQEHIEYYWRYRRSDSGKTEVWFPIVFRATY